MAQLNEPDDAVLGLAEASHQGWRDALQAAPTYRQVADEEAASGELWLHLADARQTAWLTQADLAERLGISLAQVARIERRGYDAATLATLRRCVQALGVGSPLMARCAVPGASVDPSGYT